jgi:hypothetical protein
MHSRDVLCELRFRFPGVHRPAFPSAPAFCYNRRVVALAIPFVAVGEIHDAAARAVLRSRRISSAMRPVRSLSSRAKQTSSINAGSGSAV